MKTAKLGDYFKWMGQLVRCEWINDGRKSIGFYANEKVVCPHCKKEHEVSTGHDIIESSPLFQDNAEPINTITT